LALDSVHGYEDEHRCGVVSHVSKTGKSQSAARGSRSLNTARLSAPGIKAPWTWPTVNLELQLATAAMRVVASNFASLAEAIAEKMEVTGMPDPNGSSALRLLATASVTG